MRDLNYELKKLCLRNSDGSYATQYARERILTMIANQLHEMGFRDLQAKSLKPKHVQALVERWKAEALSPGTIKNRMTELRWWAEKITKLLLFLTKAALNKTGFGKAGRTGCPAFISASVRARKKILLSPQALT